MRALVAAVATAALLPFAPSHAATGPMLLSGSGSVWPGLSIGTTAQTIAFNGTGRLLPGTTTVPCSFTGAFVSGLYPVAVGTLSGACGGVQYRDCLQVLTTTTWLIVCTNAVGVGLLATTWTSANAWSASGLFAP